jgi:hypothetical protein
VRKGWLVQAQLGGQILGGNALLYQMSACTVAVADG